MTLKISPKAKAKRRRAYLRVWAAKHRAKGLCAACAERATIGGYCLKHWIQYREYQRRMLGLKERYQQSKSYIMERALRKGG